MLHTTRGPHDSARSGVRVQEAPPEDGLYAALDLGTNNCRLLVAAQTAGDEGAVPKLKVYDSFSRIVRLGEGVSVTGALSEDAMERTLLAIKACQKKLEKYTIARSRFVATEACRRATNGPAFIERVRRELGLHIEIISTEEEARLAFAGCASLLTPDSSRAIVFDIGGGSTELMWIDIDKNKQISDWLSVGFGVMNLADKFGGTNFSDMAFGDMVSILQERFRPFDQANRITETIRNAPVQLLSTAGTVTHFPIGHIGIDSECR